MSRDMKANIEGYFYEEIVKKLFSEFISIDPLQSIRIFSKKLEVATKIEFEKKNITFQVAPIFY